MTPRETRRQKRVVRGSGQLRRTVGKNRSALGKPPLKRPAEQGAHTGEEGFPYHHDAAQPPPPPNEREPLRQPVNRTRKAAMGSGGSAISTRLISVERRRRKNNSDANGTEESACFCRGQTLRLRGQVMTCLRRVVQKRTAKTILDTKLIQQKRHYPFRISELNTTIATIQGQPSPCSYCYKWRTCSCAKQKPVILTGA